MTASLSKMFHQSCRPGTSFAAKEIMSGQVRVKKEVAQLVKFQRINLMDTRGRLRASSMPSSSATL